MFQKKLSRGYQQNLWIPLIICVWFILYSHKNQIRGFLKDLNASRRNCKCSRKIKEATENTIFEDLSKKCTPLNVSSRVKIKPAALIIGSKKSGTRALIETLGLHSKIRGAEGEVHYFDMHYAKGEEWYIDQMMPVDVRSGELAIEKSPRYFPNPDTPARVRDMDANMKLLLIVKDPVKRMLSEYNQHLFKHGGPGTDYPSFDDLAIQSDGKVDEKYSVLINSMYALHLKRWLAHFNRDQIHIVDGDKFIKHPLTEVQAIEAFLGISPKLTSDNFFFDSNKGFYCYKKFWDHPYWNCTEKKCLGESKGRKPPVVGQNTINKLVKFFKPHNKEFYDLAGKEFEWPAL